MPKQETQAEAKCDDEPGTVAPRIDPNRCEGKEDCVQVCPYSVFELRKLTEAERRALSFFARLKVAAHGGKQGFVVNPGACHGCGLCVSACPERAISLLRFDESGALA